MPDVDAVRIRRAENLADYVSCVELQKEVWGYSNMADIAAQPLLMIGDRFGGNLLIAEDASGHHVGFAFALPVWRADGVRFWWSHMTAVVEGHRKRGLGLRLKLRQREEALTAGIDRIEWTFDPLQAMNAYFNLCKLGVVVREYEDNVYGDTSSPLHRGLPDRPFCCRMAVECLKRSPASGSVRAQRDPARSEPDSDYQCRGRRAEPGSCRKNGVTGDSAGPARTQGGGSCGCDSVAEPAAVRLPSLFSPGIRGDGLYSGE